MSTDGPSDLPDEDTDRPPEDRPAREPADSRVPEPAKAETRSRQEYFEAINVNSASRQDILSFGAVMATRPAAERAKEFSPSERRIAEYLAVKGPAVVSVSEGFGVCGRTADARVDGIPVEFKSLDPGAGAVIDARDCGLTTTPSTGSEPASHVTADIHIRRRPFPGP